MLIIIHVSTISTISTNLAETGGNGLKPQDLFFLFLFFNIAHHHYYSC